MSCSKQSMDKISDRDTPETSLGSETGGEKRKTVENCELLDVEEQLLVDSLTEWILNTQYPYTRKIFWTKGSCEVCEFPIHHVWTIQRWGFLEEDA